MKTVSIFSILFLFSCSGQPSTTISENESPLEKQEQIIELSYIAWACDCANWATVEDIHKFSDNIDDTLAELSVFIEPANASLELPNTLGWNSDIIKFTGHFYKEKGFPEGYRSPEPVEKARIFQYTGYSVIKSNHWESAEGLKRLDDSLLEDSTKKAPHF